MKNTRTSEVSLARHQTQPRLSPRMAERRLRVALANVLTKTPMPRHAWDDNTRTDPRCTVACDREREMLHQAIRQGCTTPEKVVEYYLVRMADSLAQFDEAPLLEEMCYLQWFKEQGEAHDAVARLHVLPTHEHRESAIREVTEASFLSRVVGGLLRRGGSLRHQVS